MEPRLKRGSAVTNKPARQLQHGEGAASSKVDAQCDELATELSWQRFASKVANFQLPQLHLAYRTCIFGASVGNEPVWNMRDFRRKKTIPGLSYGVVCLRNSTFSHFSRRPTCDRGTVRQTDRQTHDDS